jgi:hypothetical protein
VVAEAAQEEVTQPLVPATLTAMTGAFVSRARRPRLRQRWVLPLTEAKCRYSSIKTTPLILFRDPSSR